MSQSIASPPRLWQDPLFHAALAAGPLCWLVIFLVLRPDPVWYWPIIAPLQFLLPVIVLPVLEEIVFRGLIQELVRDYISNHSLGPLSVANLLTSVLFTGLHFIHQPPLWAALVLFPSLVFGFFKDRYRILTAPILLHCFYNAGFLWMFAGPV